jgi:hypothetical protein
MSSLRAFQIHPADNVATLLDDAPADAAVAILGGFTPAPVTARESVARGHKVALRDLPAGAPVVKFGVRIGHATAAIPAGAWVHLHNLASDHDARSASLDLHSGAPTDTTEAYR